MADAWVQVVGTAIGGVMAILGGVVSPFVTSTLDASRRKKEARSEEARKDLRDLQVALSRLVRLAKLSSISAWAHDKVRSGPGLKVTSTDALLAELKPDQLRSAAAARSLYLSARVHDERVRVLVNEFVTKANAYGCNSKADLTSESYELGEMYNVINNHIGQVLRSLP
jgi:hypothetical protein